MSDFQEQLAAIAQLRDQVRQHEEALYTARIRLQNAEQQRSRAERRQTVPSPDRNAEVSRLRAEVTQLNIKLTQLREQDQAISKNLAQIADLRRLVAQLTQNRSTLRARTDRLRQQLAELQRQHAPPDEIDRLSAEMQAAERTQTQLTQAIEAASAQLAVLHQGEQDLQDRHDGAQGLMNGLRLHVQDLQRRVGELQQPVFADPQPINADIAQLTQTAAESGALAQRASRDLVSAIGGLYVDRHPRTPFSRLDDVMPVLLFPVRIETIFASVVAPGGGASTELRVRVYPDEILVHTHEAILTALEVDAGQLYWVELVAAGHLRSTQAKRQSDVWSHLVDLFGGQRAAWIAKSTRPSDWDALSAAGAAQTLIDFLSSADPTFFPGLLALQSDSTRS
jgi:predicted  nucleic acid-binding Zn-ribbon protein